MFKWERRYFLIFYGGEIRVMENDNAEMVNTDQKTSRTQERRFPKSYFMPKPVNINDEIYLTITEISNRGDGLARVKGYIVFVPNVKEGDNVKVKITQIRPNYAIGEVMQLD
jgi:predicted RNA-binding protein with TRAM domain|tara:strand:+ start:135 stop:470 length:336 start_codon:yes stop_codon:yes gene_type:complete